MSTSNLHYKNKKLFLLLCRVISAQKSTGAFVCVKEPELFWKYTVWTSIG